MRPLNLFIIACVIVAIAQVIGGIVKAQQIVMLTPGTLYGMIQKLEYRATELERKVAGMQQQITILHGKKVNK